MIRLSRIVTFGSCLAAAIAVHGCHSSAPLPLPDALRSSGLTLSATPNSLVIRPSSSGRVRFVLRDEQGTPVSDYPVAFAILNDGGGDGAVETRLSSDQGLTDGDGGAVLEIIVGNLPSDNRPAAFSVQATSQGSAPSQADVLVTTNAYSVEILPVTADNLLGPATIAATRVLFYDNTACGDLDLTNLAAAPAKPRTPRTSPPYVFSGVSAQGSHAVVGLGLDSNTFVQIGGCVDISGSSLFDSETIRATLLMDRLFPVPTGAYLVASDFKLIPPPSALPTIQAVWQQWEHCPLDPARLWLDCTLDALATDATSDPLDCIPVKGAEGQLGDLLFPRRGTTVAALGGSTADPTCHGLSDANGNPSLEAVVDALFTGTRGQLQGAKIAALPSEIASLLDDVRLDSQMTVTTTDVVNVYNLSHDLLGVTFPDAIAPITFKTPMLGLPVSQVSGILATLKAGLLSLPSHGFTLRLGTTARYAFEATSLKSRGAVDTPGLVRTIFGLAQRTDQGAALSGCVAFDAVVCDQIKQPRGCLLGACQSGLGALAGKLAGAFDKLDGNGLDFFLSGFAPVVDLGGDGRADALGKGGLAGTVSAGPGLWSAALDASAGGYVVYGSWTGSRMANSP